MSDLVAFLTARLDEDERDGYSTHRWSCFSLGVDQPAEGLMCNCGYPARVLREVEAKRKILNSYEADLKAGARTDLTQGGQIALSYVCRKLAAVYCDHADYDRAWS